MTLEYYIKVIILNVRSTTQSNCPGMFSQCYLFNVRKGTSCELSLNVSEHSLFVGVSVISAIPYRATQVDLNVVRSL